jgi:hypothetical protein
MRLSDAGVRRRKTKPVDPDHRFPPWLTEDATPRSLEPIVMRGARCSLLLAGILVRQLKFHWKYYTASSKRRGKAQLLRKFQRLKVCARCRSGRSNRRANDVCGFYASVRTNHETQGNNARQCRTFITDLRRVKVRGTRSDNLNGLATFRYGFGRCPGHHWKTRQYNCGEARSRTRTMAHYDEVELSDAGLRRRRTKALNSNHRLCSPKTRPRDRSNRLSGNTLGLPFAIVLLHQSFWGDQTPRALNQIR